jgi:hypothetical protein
MGEGNTLSTVSEALKITYPEGKFTENYENEMEFYKQIEKTSEYVYRGKQAIVPLLKGRVQGGGWRPENGDLPNARSLQAANAAVTLKYQYQRGYLTSQIMQMGTADGAFSDVLAQIIQSMDASLRKKLNFQLYRTSTGKITQVTTGATSTSFVVDSLKGLYLDQEIDFYSGATATVVAAGCIITDIAESTNTITIDTSITTTTGDYIYGAGDKDNAMNGLLDGLATSGTYMGIDKAANSWFQGKATTSVGALTDDILTKLKRQADKAGAKPTMWLTTHEVKSKIWSNLLRADRRYNDVTIAGGYKTFTYHDLPVVPDNDAPEGTAFCVDPSFIKIFRTKDFNWIDDDGNKLHWVPGKDAYELCLRGYLNMLVTYPGAIPYASGITE